MVVESDRNVLERWVAEVRGRVKGHRFAQPGRDGSASGLDLLLNRIHRVHFETNRYRYVESPMHWFSKLRLDHVSWVELQLRDCDQTRSPESVFRLLQRNECAQIVGAPGSGKSTMLRRAARCMVQELQLPSLIPMYVELPGYVRWGKEQSNGTLYRYFWEIQLQLSAHRTAEFEQFLEDLESGDDRQRSLVRLLLDGWDEVFPEERRNFVEELERLEYRVPALMATRSFSPPSKSPDWMRYDIVPPSFGEMVSLMREWFKCLGRTELESSVITHLVAGADVLETGAPGTELVPAAVSKTKKPAPRSPGRPPEYDAIADRKLYEDYLASNLTKKGFVRERNLALKDGLHALERGYRQFAELGKEEENG